MQGFILLYKSLVNVTWKMTQMKNCIFLAQMQCVHSVSRRWDISFYPPELLLHSHRCVFGQTTQSPKEKGQTTIYNEGRASEFWKRETIQIISKSTQLYFHPFNCFSLQSCVYSPPGKWRKWKILFFWRKCNAPIRYLAGEISVFTRRNYFYTAIGVFSVIYAPCVTVNTHTIANWNN
jgi:hypothetical protein